MRTGAVIMPAADAARRVGPARVGIGGPVGSGKTALIEALVPRLIAQGYDIAVVTNDIATREDAERLQKSGLIAPERVVGVETGACPHTVIREDPTLNLEAVDLLDRRFPKLDLVIVESGGDNLASTFSLDLVDYWLFVIDIAGGGDIPRKRGPGVLQCDLLVVNKTDLAPYVRVNMEEVRRDVAKARGVKPALFTNCLTGEGIDAVIAELRRSVLLDA
ncbi:MAG: urease accessory protein UreG [Alphaproteobacteria bacterium]|nr:urease accessory protein UreG [Alphaproteobacteria bacterium]